MGPQTPRIPSLRTESAREEQCLQTDGFWEDWTSQGRASPGRAFGVFLCALAGAVGWGGSWVPQGCGLPHPCSGIQDLQTQTQAHGPAWNQILGKPRLTCPGLWNPDLQTQAQGSRLEPDLA